MAMERLRYWRRERPVEVEMPWNGEQWRSFVTSGEVSEGSRNGARDCARETKGSRNGLMIDCYLLNLGREKEELIGKLKLRERGEEKGEERRGETRRSGRWGEDAVRPPSPRVLLEVA